MTIVRAKIFRNGGSQAIRLPKEFRFPENQHEVVVRRDGPRIILEAEGVWPEKLIACLGAWAEDIERPTQLPLSRLKDPFK